MEFFLNFLVSDEEFQVQGQDPQPLQRTGCSSCGRERQLSRCAHCDNVICDTCKRSHMDQLRLDINRLVSQLRRGMPVFSDSISTIENKSEQLHQRAEAGKAEITEMMERYISEMRNRQRLLHSEVQMWLLGEIRSLRMCQENVEVELASTASFCDSTESTLARSNTIIPDEDLVDIRRQCVEHMENMRAYEEGNGVRLPRERQVQVLFEGNRLSQVITNFGDLVVVDGSENNTGSNPSGPSSTENSRSSSSREPSPMSHPSGAAGSSGVAPSASQNENASVLDRALAMIGSSQVGTARQGVGSNQAGATRPSPRVARRGERVAGLMGGGGEETTAATNVSRLGARDRMLALVGAGGAGIDSNLNPISNLPNTTRNVSNTASNLTTTTRNVSNTTGNLPNATRNVSNTTGNLPNTTHNVSNTSGNLPNTTRNVSNTTGNLPDTTNNSSSTNNVQTPASNVSRAVAVERVAGMAAVGGGEEGGETPVATGRRPLPPNLSWELPVDFSYPRRADIRVGNGSSANTRNRRSLAERRRHNLSDTRIAGVIGGAAARTAAVSNIRRAQTDIQTGSRNTNNVSSQNSRSNQTANTRTSSQATPVSSTSTDTSTDRPPIVRSRTFTRDDMQTIREEDSQSRASTAESATRTRRSPVHFDIDLNGDDENGEDIELPLQMGGSDGSESTRVNVARNNYQDKGRAIIRFGTRGSDNSQFVWPRGVAVSRSDQIFVADSSNHRVQVFDNIGTYIKTFGSYGQAESEFDCLAGIAINSMGDILITDRYNHRIQVFDHQGNFKVEFGEEGQGDGQMSYPWGIGTDGMGFIYVCDKENHRVQVFQSSGVFVRKFGRLGRVRGQFENPHYLAVSKDNKIYVSDCSNHRIQVFSMYGDFLFSFGSVGTMQGQMKYPKGLAIDDQGFVVVADSGNNRIQVFRGDGRFYCMFGSYGSDSGQFKGLEGLAILSNGNVVVSDRENHRIQIF